MAKRMVYKASPWPLDANYSIASPVIEVYVSSRRDYREFPPTGEQQMSITIEGLLAKIPGLAEGKIELRERVSKKEG